MKRLQWLKVKVGLYSDPRMIRMLRQPHGDTFHLILSVLRDFAGAINHDGFVYITEQEPLTSQDLSHYLHRRTSTIDKALDYLEQLEFISRSEDGIIRILDWDELQGSDKDQLRREQTRKRVAKCRQRQKEAAQEQPAPVDTEMTDMAEEYMDSDTEDIVTEPVAEEQDTLPVRTDSYGLTRIGDIDAGTTTKGWRDDPCIVAYQQYFGQIGAECASKLLEMERDWGELSLLNAIEIAKDRGISNVKYMRAILVNGNGRTERKENANNGYQDTAAILDEVFPEPDESVEGVRNDPEEIPSYIHVRGTW